MGKKNKKKEDGIRREEKIEGKRRKEGAEAGTGRERNRREQKGGK